MAGVGVTTLIFGKITAVGIATGAGVVAGAAAGAASTMLHNSAGKAETAAEGLEGVRS